MKKSTKHIDDLFKEELGNYAETPPPAGWDALEKRLGTAATPLIPARWLGYVVVASLLVVVGTTVAVNKYNSEKQQLAQTETGLTKISTPAAQEEGIAGSKADNENNTAVNENNTAVSSGTGAAANGTTESVGTPLTEHNIAGNNQIGAQSVGNSSKRTVIYNSSGKPVTKVSSTNKNNGPVFAATDQPGGASRPDGLQTVGSSKDNEWNAGSIANGNQQAATKGTQAENNPAVLNAGTANSTSDAQTEQKKDSAGKKKMTIARVVPPKPKKQRTVNLFEAGIKGGYETGFNNDAAKKIVVAPYLQVNVSDRLAIVLQPSVKTSFLNTRRIGTPASYYDVNPDGKSAQSGSSTPINIIGGGVLYMTKYHYTESHDSIVKTSTLNRSYMEFEVPVLVKYNLDKNFSAYGGVNIAYSKAVSIVERTNNIPNINVAKDTFVITATPAQAEPLPVRSVISYSGNSIASYSGPQYAANQGSEVRLGYMVGFSYEYSRRWLFDALVQQGFAKAKQVGGYDINTTLSAPYVRLMLGYKLTK